MTQTPALKKFSDSDIVRILHKAGTKNIKEIFPKYFKVKLDSHSTAKGCKIYLKLDGEKPLLVWYKTNWVSSSYEFNERGKINGFQPECDFVKGELNKLFYALDDYINFIDRRNIDLKNKDIKDKKLLNTALIKKYKEAYEGLNSR